MGRFKRYGVNNKYETRSNSRNTPHLIENTLIIVLTIAFSGLNFIAFGLLSLENAGIDFSRNFIEIGIIMLLAVPIKIQDDRIGMRGTFVASCSCIIHLAVCLLFSIKFSFWWMCVYAGEVILCLSIILITKRYIRLK